MTDGFSSWEANALMWRVYHNNGQTIVYATTESIALSRFLAKYPNYIVSDIKRA